MKRLLFTLLLLFAPPCMAADITFAWDPMPEGQNWTEVRVYERFGSAEPYTYSEPVCNGTDTVNTCTATGVTSGAHTYIARAFDGTWESVDSNSVSTPALPGAPGNLKIQVVVTVEVPQ